MPNGNDKWAQYEEKAAPAQDKWEQYAEPVRPVTRIAPQPVAADRLAANAPRPDKGSMLHRTAEIIRKTTRAGTLKAFERLGIPEAPTSTSVLTGALKQTGKELYETGKELVTDEAAPAKMLSNVLTGFGEAGKEAWQGLKESDPEKFARGFASAYTDIWSLGLGATGSEATLKPRARLAAVKTGIEAGAEETAHLKTVMPTLVKMSEKAGINTVGEVGKTVQTALDQHEATFNQAMAPVRRQLVDTASVQQRILSLIKPDSSKAEVAYIKRAAREYLQPKTMDWLDARRKRLNASTSSIWKKSSGAASTTMRTDLDMAIDKTARNAVADLQYDVLDRANPGAGFRNLKTQQTALWHLSDFLTDKVLDLESRQLTFEEEGGRLGRLRPGAYLSRGAGLHGYVSGLADIFTGGPEELANKRVRKGLGGPRVSKRRLAAMSLPVAHLLPERRTTPFGLTPPPAAPRDDNQ